MSFIHSFCSHLEAEPDLQCNNFNLQTVIVPSNLTTKLLSVFPITHLWKASDGNYFLLFLTQWDNLLKRTCENLLSANKLAEQKVMSKKILKKIIYKALMLKWSSSGFCVDIQRKLVYRSIFHGDTFDWVCTSCWNLLGMYYATFLHFKVSFNKFLILGRIALKEHHRWLIWSSRISFDRLVSQSEDVFFVLLLS